MIHRELKLIPVEPQPQYIESSGRWCWPLPDKARLYGCCTEVVTASREWWKYAPSEAKPHPLAEGVRLRDDVWYWAVPNALVTRPVLQELRDRIALLEAVREAVEKMEHISPEVHMALAAIKETKEAS